MTLRNFSIRRDIIDVSVFGRVRVRTKRSISRSNEHFKLKKYINKQQNVLNFLNFVMIRLILIVFKKKKKVFK